MARVFKLYPETGRARESFEDAVRQAEDQLNIRKAELLRLRSEISKLKAERETLAKAIAAAAPPEVPVSSPTAPAAPPPAAPASTAAALGGRPLASAPKGLLQLPGFYASTGTIAAPPADEKAQPPTPSLAVSSPSASQPPTADAAPPAELLALAEVDEKLSRKTADLAQKEEEFKAVQASAEKNLLELESRKTDLLLGKIHRAVQDVARREGISVVVDKTGILYGQDAVDLTEKVLQSLRGG
ncbi:MAG: OmpH family outer membrane protein [Elusimicrobia bacterium]|nr:OmpH family outer membrane protein [Elusimicrobiota bacterium]